MIFWSFPPIPHSLSKRCFLFLPFDLPLRALAAPTTPGVRQLLPSPFFSQSSQIQGFVVRRGSFPSEVPPTAQNVFLVVGCRTPFSGSRRRFWSRPASLFPLFHFFPQCLFPWAAFHDVFKGRCSFFLAHSFSLGATRSSSSWVCNSHRLDSPLSSPGDAPPCVGRVRMGPTARFFCFPPPPRPSRIAYRPLHSVSVEIL